MASSRHVSIPILLSINGGFVDAAGFLALQGLFAAHVTGNFVTLGAALVRGTSGTVPKLLALPVFCAVVFLARMFIYRSDSPRILLGMQGALLSAVAVMALALGPFNDGDSSQALVTGMTLVAAMAIQSTVTRVYLTKAVSTTTLTSSALQLMTDLADIVHHDEKTYVATRAHLRSLGFSVLAFVGGCAMATWFYTHIGERVFMVPPLFVLASIALWHVPAA